MLPYYELKDPRFRSLIQPQAHLEQVATGFRWAEGPVWFPAAQVLLFSDIPNQRIMRLTPDGQLSVFRQPSGFANGHTRDREGRLVSCHHGLRAVTRTEHDGSVTMIADRFDGGQLNSPNDVVVKSDGSIWFTDPTYGILGDYEGYRSDPEQPVHGVYRVGTDGAITRVVHDDFVQPNGLAFSPDESELYIAESGSSHDASVPSIIRAYPVQGDTLGRPRVHCTIDAGLPDGFRVDRSGNIWCSAADGIQVFAPDGVMIGKIKVPEVVANLTFGGPAQNRLFITATTSVYAIYVEAMPCGWPDDQT